MSKKVVSLVIGLITLVAFILYTAYVINTSVNASRDATLKQTLGSGVATLAAYLAEGSRGLRAAALATKNAWALEQMPPWNAGNDSRSLFLLDSIMSIQQGFPMLRYVYLSYQLPNGAGWGDLGCQASANMGAPYSCYYVNTSGMMLFSDTANVSQVSSVEPFGDTSEETYTRVIRGLTSKNINGYWMQPEYWIDTLYNTTTRIMSFTLPIAFDPVTGNCTLAATTDLDLGSTSLGLRGFGQNGEMVILDGRGTGYLIDGSMEHFFTSTPLSTPSPRINDLISTFRNYNGGNYLVNASFTQNGFTYQSATVDNAFVLINRSPVQVQGAVAAAALKSTFDLITLPAYSMLTGLTMYFTNNGAANFQFAINNPTLRQSSSWFATAQALLSAVFPKIAYLYVDYQYTSSRDGTTQWGEAGTYFSGNATAGPQGLPDDFTSYITADNVTDIKFYNANLSDVSSVDDPSIYNSSQPWIVSARQLTSADRSGRWSQLWWGPNDKKAYMSFQIPISFDAGNNCIMALGADVNLIFLRQYLKQYMASDATSLSIIDTRLVGGSPVVVASATATYSASKIFTAATLPDTSLGSLITRAAAAAPGGNFTSQLVSFSYYDAPSSSVVNVIRLPDPQLVNWAVVEVLPASNLQLFGTSASATASSFTTLFTPAQRAGIVIFAIAIILLILIDHIIVLTISVGGNQGDGKWGEAMNSAN